MTRWQAVLNSVKQKNIYRFTVCFLKSGELQIINFFSANKVAILCSVDLLDRQSPIFVHNSSENVYEIRNVRKSSNRLMFYNVSSVPIA
jgi:hypothetical protein